MKKSIKSILGTTITIFGVVVLIDYCTTLFSTRETGVYPGITGLILTMEFTEEQITMAPSLSPRIILTFLICGALSYLFHKITRDK